VCVVAGAREEGRGREARGGLGPAVAVDGEARAVGEEAAQRDAVGVEAAGALGGEAPAAQAAHDRRVEVEEVVVDEREGDHGRQGLGERERLEGRGVGHRTDRAGGPVRAAHGAAVGEADEHRQAGHARALDGVGGVRVEPALEGAGGGPRRVAEEAGAGRGDAEGAQPSRPRVMGRTLPGAVVPQTSPAGRPAGRRRTAGPRVSAGACGSADHRDADRVALVGAGDAQRLDAQRRAAAALPGSARATREVRRGERVVGGRRDHGAAFIVEPATDGEVWVSRGSARPRGPASC
jgi:hypothetical protein